MFEPDFRAALPRAGGPASSTCGPRRSRLRSGLFRFPDPNVPIHIIGHSMGGLDARMPCIGISRAWLCASHRSRRSADRTGVAPSRTSSWAPRRAAGSRAAALYRARRVALRRSRAAHGCARQSYDRIRRQFNREHRHRGHSVLLLRGQLSGDDLLRVAVLISGTSARSAERENDGLVSVALLPGSLWPRRLGAPIISARLGDTSTPAARFASRLPHLEALAPDDRARARARIGSIPRRDGSPSAHVNERDDASRAAVGRRLAVDPLLALSLGLDGFTG